MITSTYLRKKDQDKLKLEKQPKIILSKEAFRQFTTYVRAKEVEIMLLGFVDKEIKEDSVEYTITRFIVPPQTNNSPTFVTTDDDAYHKWLYEMPRDMLKKLKCHLHTHPKMSVTPSPTDNNMIGDKVENIDDFYIRMIASNDFKLRADLFDIEAQKLHSQIEVSTTVEDSGHILNFKLTITGVDFNIPIDESFVKELDSKIKEREHAPYVPNSTYGYIDKDVDEMVQKYYNNPYSNNPAITGNRASKQPDTKPTIITIEGIQNKNTELLKQDWYTNNKKLKAKDYVQTRYNVVLKRPKDFDDLEDALREEISIIMNAPDCAGITLEEVQRDYIAHLDKICKMLKINYPTTKYVASATFLVDWAFNELI